MQDRALYDAVRLYKEYLKKRIMRKYCFSISKSLNYEIDKFGPFLCQHGGLEFLSFATRGPHDQFGLGPSLMFTATPLEVLVSKLKCEI